MRVVGHRGAAGQAEENTLAAIESAIISKADAIELDIRRSADNELVLHHDDSTLRMTNDDYTIRTTRWTDLRSVTTIGGNKIIRLEDALVAAGSMPVILDLKDAHSAQILKSKIHSSGSVSVTSFKLSELITLRSEFPGMPLYLATYTRPLKAIRLAKQYKLNGITVNHRWFIINPFIYWRAKNSKLQVLTYPVNKLYAKTEELLWCRTIKAFYSASEVLLCTDYPHTVKRQ